MKKIKAVIFDWAGTIIDFGCMAPANVFVNVFNEWGVAITQKEARTPMGLAKKDHLIALCNMERIQQEWIATHGQKPTMEEIQKMYDLLAPKMTDLVSAFASPIPGVTSQLDALRAQNIKLGSTTGYVSEMMEKILPIAAAEGLVLDSVVNSSDCKEGRPSPFMIFRNMENLGIYSVDEVIKVGDTVADIQEGLNAGVWTIGITTTGNEVGLNLEDWLSLTSQEKENLRTKAADKLSEAGAHFIIHDMRELPELIDEINLILESEQDLA